MNASRLTYFMALALALTFAATGCKKKKPNVTEIPGRSGAVGSNPIPDGPRFIPGDGVNGGVNRDELSSDFGGGDLEGRFNFGRAELASYTVQFAYDSVAIRSTEQSKVDAVAAYLKSAPGSVGLLIEGHCDERGTEEYNRALGERRALALRETLMASGVAGNRITTRSYGKDRKVDTGNSEAAHARNRRGEFVTLTPK